MNSRILAAVLGAAVVSAVVAPVHVCAADWLPIDAADLAADHSTIDPDAGAEILYHEKTVDDDLDEGTRISEYFRVKVYNEKGVEAFDKIDIPAFDDSSINSLAARIVKRDGTIVNLDRKAFYTRDAVRVGKKRVRVKSFSFPGLEPGVIVEYRWNLITDESIGGLYVPLQAEDMPTRRLRLRVRPYAYPGLLTQTICHRCDQQKFQEDKDGFFLIEMKDLAAVKDEAFSPPETERQSWILFYFTFKNETPEAYWQRTGKSRLAPLEKKARERKEISAALGPIIAGAKSDLAKLSSIHDFCRGTVRNTALGGSGFTPDQIAALKKNDSAVDTLQRHYGTPEDINVLFVALARAAGFDARFVLCCDREETFFDPKIMWEYALSDLVCGVQIGEEWHFFDPGATYVEAGSLHWENEGVQALVLDRKHCTWVKTPLTAPENSRITRTARLKIDEEGTLEGEVSFAFSGHEAVDVKEDLAPRAPEEFEDLMRERLKKRLSTAEVSDVEIKNAADPLQPVTMRYHIRVPAYAERTGQRLFFQPAYFEKGRDATFTASSREYDLYFPYPWSEEDSVIIDLPAGFVLEDANSPLSLTKGKVINYEALVGVTRSNTKMMLTRKFDFHPLLIGKSNYPAVKQTFDVIHTGDEHTLILKRADAAVTAAPGAAPAPAATVSTAAK